MQPVVQKFFKGVLVGVLGFFLVGLLLFFVTTLYQGTQGRTGMMYGNDASGTSMVQPEIGMMGRGGVGGGVVADEGVASPMVAEKMALGAPEGDMAADMMPGEVSSTDKKVMKDGSLDIRVQNADEAAESIRQIAEAKGGSVEQSNFWRTTDDVKTGSVTVKVPVDKFDETFTELKKVATFIVSESVSGSDVTEQFIDLQARLKNKKAQEEALQNVLNKAEKVSDIIDVTRALGNVRAEIESLEGQIRYFNNQTDLAALTVLITEDTRVTPDGSFRPGQSLAEAVSELLWSLGKIATGLMMFVIVALPIFLVFGLVFWIIFIVVRKIVMKFWN